MFMQAPLNANVFARYPRDVKLISAAGLTEIGIALAHGQITRALFRVALSLASTAGKAILALAAALAELLAEILRLYARTRVVALTTRMIARCEIVNVVSTGIFLQLNLPAMHRPEPMLLLLLPRRREVFQTLDRRYIGSFLLRELINLLAGFRQHNLRESARVPGKRLVQRAKQALLRSGPRELIFRFDTFA